MKKFFPEANELLINNSLSTAEGYFYDHRANGLIEKHYLNRTAVLLIISGIPGMAYTIEGGESKSILLSEFSMTEGETSRIRVVDLPDIAGRLTWLSLESHAKDRFSLTGNDLWQKQLAQWNQDRWNGLVEITAEKLHGFVFFWHGEIQPSEIIFSTPQGFITDFPALAGTNDLVWEITLYAHSNLAQAYQYTVLRHGAVEWSNQILSRYREIVGEKLLKLLDRELNRQIQPWQWNITINENEMFDAHFFPTLEYAVNAYRSLFMEMGVQMDFVIGNTLTRRLLNETFEQIHPDERAILKSQRLIPDAFL